MSSDDEKQRSSEVPRKFGQMEGGDSIDEAAAKGIDFLSGLERIVTMSHISRKEVDPIVLAFSMGKELGTGVGGESWDWLVDLAKFKLGVLVSVKGRGRASVENSVKGSVERGGVRGAMDKVGGFITGK